MGASTEKALRGSISKWQKIVKGTGVDLGSENCPLCMKFMDHDVFDCGGCPVARAGHEACDDTPYQLFSDLVDYGKFAITNEAKIAAQDEVDFLKSLLPKRKKKAK